MTVKLLHVDSSITGEASVTRQLSAAIVDRLRRTNPRTVVVRRDLVAEPLPYFSVADLGGVAVQPEPQPSADGPIVRLDRRLLDEFMTADTVVVGAPMYNFGVSAHLKSWIDYLSIAGVTFQYGPQGPVGLAGGKRVIIASSRGGLYSPGFPAAPFDHQETYLQAVFGFYGITDVTIVRAEGVRIGPDKASEAMSAALAEVEKLAA